MRLIEQSALIIIHETVIINSLMTFAMFIATVNQYSMISFFFFSGRRRHTSWPRDWSSDVCSSDLDQRWLLPHFEKMLYDQALMIMAYTEAFQATGDAFFRTTAEEIIEYVFRDLSDDAGAFYSAEDADSEGEEGKFYVWTTDEVRAVLSADDARFVNDWFGMEDGGNFEDEATRRRTGANVLHSDDLDKWDGAERTRWDRIRQDLLEQ